MRSYKLLGGVAFIAALVLAGYARAETKVTISGVHLCCPACVSAVDKTLGGLGGIKHEAKQGTKSITFTAASDEAAQKAIDALAAAGFYGTVDNKAVKYKDVAAPEGKVERLELTGVHNCCGACSKSIRDVIAKVDGVSGNTVKVRETSFVVEGKFSAAELVKGMLDAGFYVQVKK